MPAANVSPPSTPRARGGGDEVAADLLELHAHKTLAGDKAAQREFIERSTPWIQRCVTTTLTRYVIGGIRACSEEEIEDFVQDVHLKVMTFDHAVLRQWARQSTPLSPYLAAVTRNVVISSLRTQSRDPRRCERLPDDPGVYENSDDELEMRLEAEDFECAMRARLAKLEESLGEREITAIGLTKQGRSIGQVAKRAGMPRRAVTSLYARIGELAITLGLRRRARTPETKR